MPHNQIVTQACTKYSTSEVLTKLVSTHGETVDVTALVPAAVTDATSKYHTLPVGRPVSVHCNAVSGADVVTTSPFVLRARSTTVRVSAPAESEFSCHETVTAVLFIANAETPLGGCGAGGSNQHTLVVETPGPSLVTGVTAHCQFTHEGANQT